MKSCTFFLVSQLGPTLRKFREVDFSRTPFRSTQLQTSQLLLNYFKTAVAGLNEFIGSVKKH